MGSRQKRASIVFKTNFYCLKGYKGEGMSENDQISASVLYGWFHSILYEYYFLFRLFMLCSTKVPFWFVFSTTPPSYFILRPCYAWVLCYMKLNKIELYYVITVLLNCFWVAQKSSPNHLSRFAFPKMQLFWWLTDVFFNRFRTRKFYIERNNNEVDSLETGRIACWFASLKNLEKCMNTTLF